MRDEGTYLGGAYPTANKGQAMNSPPMHSDAFIVGDFLVVDPTSTPRFDEKMSLKEDYDMTAQHLGEPRPFTSSPAQPLIPHPLHPLQPSFPHCLTTSALHPCILSPPRRLSLHPLTLTTILTPHPQSATYSKVTRSNRLNIQALHYTNEGGAVGDRGPPSKDQPLKKEQYNIAVLRHKWPGAFPQQ